LPTCPSVTAFDPRCHIDRLKRQEYCNEYEFTTEGRGDMKKYLFAIIISITFLCQIFLCSMKDVYADVPFMIGGDPIVDPADFRITKFAMGLSFPSSISQLSDGALMVATSQAHGGLFDTGGGTLRYLKDNNNDGIADVNSILYMGLPGTVTSVVQAGDLIFANSAENNADAISVLRSGTNPSDPLTLVGSVNFGYPSGPSGWLHTTFELAVRETPSLAGNYDIFFNVGSKEDNVNTTDTIPLTGLLTGTVNGDSIYKFTVDDSGSTPALSGLQQIATGVRNGAGIEIQPSTGDLYFEDNGINNPDAADELNRLTAAHIGSAIEDFGFAENYTEYISGNLIGDTGNFIQPLQVFQPIGASESKGPFKIAFAPKNFPTGLNNGIFMGFHGGQGENNAVVYVDFTHNKYDYFHFIESSIDGVGHLDEVFSTDNSLYIADLSRTGELFSGGVGQGVIYQLTPRITHKNPVHHKHLSTPEPATFFLFGSGLLGAFIRRHRRS